MEWERWRELANTEWARIAMFRITQSIFSADLLGITTDYWAARLREDVGPDNQEWAETLIQKCATTNLLDIVLGQNHVATQRLARLQSLDLLDERIAACQAERLAIVSQLDIIEREIQKKWGDMGAILKVYPPTNAFRYRGADETQDLEETHDQITSPYFSRNK